MAVPRLKPFLRGVLPVTALVAVCMLAATIASTLAILGSGAGVLEANVSSRIPVDYSADQVPLKIPRLSQEIIDAIRRDRAAEGSDSASPGGPGSQTPPGTVPTPGPSGGATRLPTTTPTPLLPVPSPLPTLPVPTPTPPPIPTLPPTPTPPVVPTLPPAPTLPVVPPLP